MKQVVIFGTGDIAQLANFYLESDSEYDVVAFTVDRAYMQVDLFEGKPVIPFDEIETCFPPSAFSVFIALSYKDMNQVRELKFWEAKKMGYTLISYVSSKCSYLSQFPCGENCFILEDNTIQPFVRIGDNVTLWSGNHIGHHSVIEAHNFISSHVVISGHCKVWSNCFIGVNATVHHYVELAKGTLVGAGAIISSNTDENDVWVPEKAKKMPKKSFDIKF